MLAGMDPELFRCTNAIPPLPLRYTPWLVPNAFGGAISMISSTPMTPSTQVWHPIRFDSNVFQSNYIITRVLPETVWPVGALLGTTGLTYQGGVMYIVSNNVSLQSNIFDGNGITMNERIDTTIHASGSTLHVQTHYDKYEFGYRPVTFSANYNQWINSSMIIQSSQEAIAVGIDLSLDYANNEHVQISIIGCQWRSSHGYVRGQGRSNMLGSVSVIKKRTILPILDARPADINIRFNDCHWYNITLRSTATAGNLLTTCTAFIPFE
jgi:hypothetical protein